MQPSFRKFICCTFILSNILLKHLKILTVQPDLCSTTRSRYHYCMQSHYALPFQIRYVRASDAGSYECQVSTVPKISKLFHLKVVIPKVCKLRIRVTSQSHLHIANQ